jgi:hypothetical protein
VSLRGLSPLGVLSTAKFGAIATMGYEPELRAMLLCPVSENEQVRSASRYVIWRAMVLADDPKNPDCWPVGHIVTVAPGAPSVIILPEAED